MTVAQRPTGVPLLDVRALSVGLRDRSGKARPIVSEIDLRLATNETLGIVGESGSGKSTLALALMGYLRPGVEHLDGSVCFDGHELFGADAQAAALHGNSIAIVPQNAAASLTPTMTIARQFDEALALHTKLSPPERRDAALALLEDLQLPNPTALARRYPHELSGGQQQRCILGLALAGRPRLMILDEPTAALDAATQAGVLKLLRTIGEQNQMAMVYISHSLGVVSSNCERLAVMYAGEIVEQGKTDRLLRSPSHPYTSGLLGSLPSIQRPGIPPAIWGTPPGPGAIDVGCQFAPRCSDAQPLCALRPTLVRSPTGGAVRCHFPRSPQQQFRQTTHRAASAGECILRVEGLVFAYRSPGLISRLFRHSRSPNVIENVGFELRTGETLGVIGESGSGKSTLLQLLLGLLTPQAGRGRISDHDLTVPFVRRPLELKRKVQIVFQNPGGTLNPRQTIAEILDSPLRLYFGGTDASKRLRRAMELLDRVRLSRRYLPLYPGQLSGGEKQRVAIARAVAAKPEIILCDEVTSALDVSVQAAVLQVLDEIQREEKTAYVFVSHDLATVRAIADHVVVLMDGRICEAGPAASVFDAPTHPYARALIANTFDPARLTADALAAGAECSS